MTEIICEKDPFIENVQIVNPLSQSQFMIGLLTHMIPPQPQAG